MSLPAWSVLLVLPRVWRALRRARTRLARGLEPGLTLAPIAARYRPVPVERWAQAVFGLGRRMRGCACLTQAVALAQLLRAAGHPARVIIAATREDGVFRAHAWVDNAGMILDPQPERVSSMTHVQSFG